MMTPEQEQLIHAYLDGAASDVQIQTLDRLLQDDADLRQALLTESLFYIQVRRVAKGADHTASLASKKRSPATPGWWGMLLPRRAYAIMAVAASLLLLITGAWYVLANRHTNAVAVTTVSAPVKPVTPAPTPVKLETPASIPAKVIGLARCLRGHVSLISPRDTSCQVVDEPRQITDADTLEVADGAEARVDYDDGSWLIVYPRSRLTFGTSGAGKRIKLNGGAFDAAIVAQPANCPMIVSTSRLQEEVVGTEFRVVDTSAASWVAVKSGHVTVSRSSDGQSVEVQPNQYAAVHPTIPFQAIPADTCLYWRQACTTAVGGVYP